MHQQQYNITIQLPPPAFSIFSFLGSTYITVGTCTGTQLVLNNTTTHEIKKKNKNNNNRFIIVGWFCIRVFAFVVSSSSS